MIAVHARVQPPADPPAEERRLAVVEDRVPATVPREQLGVLLEALREVLLGKALEDRLVVGVGLLLEVGGRRDVLLFAPMHGDLGFRVLPVLGGAFAGVCHLKLSSQRLDPFMRTEAISELSRFEGLDASPASLIASVKYTPVVVGSRPVRAPIRSDGAIGWR
jgi:hypothetical protein